VGRGQPVECGVGAQTGNILDTAFTEPRHERPGRKARIDTHGGDFAQAGFGAINDVEDHVQGAIHCPAGDCEAICREGAVPTLPGRRRASSMSPVVVPKARLWRDVMEVIRCRNRARPDWHRGALIDGSM